MGCYLECTVNYKEAQLKDLHINPATVTNVTKLSHEAKMHVSCESGYETACKKDYDIYECVGDKGAPANEIALKECTKKPVNLVVIISVVAALVIVSLVVLMVWLQCRG